MGVDIAIGSVVATLVVVVIKVVLATRVAETAVEAISEVDLDSGTADVVDAVFSEGSKTIPLVSLEERVDTLAALPANSSAAKIIISVVAASAELVGTDTVEVISMILLIQYPTILDSIRQAAVHRTVVIAVQIPKWSTLGPMMRCNPLISVSLPFRPPFPLPVRSRRPGKLFQVRSLESPGYQVATKFRSIDLKT